MTRPAREPHLKWQAFAKQFGLKKPGIIPWDPDMLEAQLSVCSRGERHIIAFLLRTWDPGHPDWPRFDLHAAIKEWGGAPEPFLEWLKDPWWP